MSADVIRLRRTVLPYTELKSSTYFSFLKGASSPQQMVEEAVKLGLRGIAITDIGGVYGAPRAYQALEELKKKFKEAQARLVRKSKNSVSGISAGGGAKIPENELESELTPQEVELLELDAQALEQFKLIIGSELVIRAEISDGSNVSYLGSSLKTKSAMGGAAKNGSALKSINSDPFHSASGVESLLPLPSIVMLAPNRAAYGGMCRLLTESHRGRPKGTGDLSFIEFQSWLKSLPHADELILFPQWEAYWQASRNEAARALHFYENEKQNTTSIGALAVKLASAHSAQESNKRFEENRDEKNEEEPLT